MHQPIVDNFDLFRFESPAYQFLAPPLAIDDYAVALAQGSEIASGD